MSEAYQSELKDSTKRKWGYRIKYFQQIQNQSDYEDNHSEPNLVRILYQGPF